MERGQPPTSYATALRQVLRAGWGSEGRALPRLAQLQSSLIHHRSFRSSATAPGWSAAPGRTDKSLSGTLAATRLFSPFGLAADGGTNAGPAALHRHRLRHTRRDDPRQFAGAGGCAGGSCLRRFRVGSRDAWTLALRLDFVALSRLRSQRRRPCRRARSVAVLAVRRRCRTAPWDVAGLASFAADVALRTTWPSALPRVVQSNATRIGFGRERSRQSREAE
jgi:hypothetical protein